MVVIGGIAVVVKVLVLKIKIVSTGGFLFAMRIQIPNPNVFPVLDWGLPTSPCPRIGRGAGVCRCADADAADAVVVGQIGPSNSGLQLFVGDVC